MGELGNQRGKIARTSHLGKLGQVVGEFRKCYSERLTENTVSFYKNCKSPSQELGFEKKQILKRIQKLEGCSLVKELKIS